MSQKIDYELNVKAEQAQVEAQKLGTLLEKITITEKQLIANRAKLAKVQEELAGKTELTVKEMQQLASAEKAVFVTTQQLTAAQSQLSESQNKVVQTSGTARNAVFNLNRVVQDAPFGLLGMANNIDPLVSEFQRLQKESGGTMAALKAMAGGLIGPAGIALAISTVTSSLIMFGPQIKKFFTGEVEDATEVAKEYIKALEELNSRYASAFGLDPLEKTRKDLERTVELIAELESKRVSKEITVRMSTGAGPGVEVGTGKFEMVGTPEQERDLVNLRKEQADLTLKLKEQEKVAASETVKMTESEIALRERMNELIKEQDAAIEQRSGTLKAEIDAKIESEERLIELEQQRNLTQLELYGFTVETRSEEEIYYQEEVRRREETELWYQTLNGLETSLADLTKETEKGVTEAVLQSTNAQVAGLDQVTAAKLRNIDLTQKQAEAEQKAQEQAAAAIGNTVAQAIMAGDSFEEISKAFIRQTLVEVIALSVKGAFMAGGPLGAFIAPAAAALAVTTFNALVSGGGGNIGKEIGNQIDSGSRKTKNTFRGFARGVENFAGGMALVGEQGPELVSLPAGSNVVSNENTRSLMNSVSPATAGSSSAPAMPELSQLVQGLKEMRVVLSLYDLETANRQFNQVWVQGVI